MSSENHRDVSPVSHDIVSAVQRKNGNGRVEGIDLWGLYLDEATRVPLLTHEEEIELFKKVEAGRAARERLAEGVSDEKEKDQLSQVVDDGTAATEHLVSANQRLIINKSKEFLGRGVPREDLVQEGNIGLLRSIKKFDHRRGYKFSTYATWWVRQAMSRATRDFGRTIRIPTYMGDAISKMKKYERLLEQKLSRKPTDEELAEATRKTVEQIQYMKVKDQRPKSLEEPIGEEEDREFGFGLEDITEETPSEVVERKLLAQQVREELELLAPSEERVLQYRYPLNGEKELTFPEIGRAMGFTRQRAREVTNQALQKLRNPETLSRLRGY